MLGAAMVASTKFWPAKAPLAAVLPKPAAAALGIDLVAGRNYFKVYTTAIRGRAKDGRALSQWLQVDAGLAAMSGNPDAYLQREQDAAIRHLKNHPDFDNARPVVIQKMGLRIVEPLR